MRAQLVDPVVHFWIEWLQVLLSQKVVGGVSLGVQCPNAVQLFEDHRRQQVIYCKGIVGMRLYRCLELSDRLVILEVIEVFEALARVSVIGRAGRYPGAPVVTTDRTS